MIWFSISYSQSLCNVFWPTRNGFLFISICRGTGLVNVHASVIYKLRMQTTWCWFWILLAAVSTFKCLCTSACNSRYLQRLQAHLSHSSCQCIYAPFLQREFSPRWHPNQRHDYWSISKSGHSGRSNSASWMTNSCHSHVKHAFALSDLTSTAQNEGHDHA